MTREDIKNKAKDFSQEIGRSQIMSTYCIEDVQQLFNEGYVEGEVQGSEEGFEAGYLKALSDFGIKL
jgi:flagellar biosynthesis/type III secretory pathway protein FliH